MSAGKETKDIHNAILSDKKLQSGLENELKKHSECTQGGADIASIDIVKEVGELKEKLEAIKAWGEREKNYPLLVTFFPEIYEEWEAVRKEGLKQSQYGKRQAALSSWFKKVKP